MLLRNELAELAARQRLDAALEQPHADGQHPELRGLAQEERREQRDAEVRADSYQQHALRAESCGQTPVGDGRRERHELRHQQRQNQLRRIDAEVGAVACGHLYNGVHAVDVAKER